MTILESSFLKLNPSEKLPLHTANRTAPWIWHSALYLSKISEIGEEENDEF